MTTPILFRHKVFRILLYQFDYLKIKKVISINSSFEASDDILAFFSNIQNSLIFANKITNLILYIILICNTGKTRVIKLPINSLLMHLNQQLKLNNLIINCSHN